MADMEEPPSKITKFEMESQYLDGTEVLEEGHEEWLSEGVLTDDDQHHAGQTSTENISQDAASMESTDQTQEINQDIIQHMTQDISQDINQDISQDLSQDISQDMSHSTNIEDTLNSLENAQDSNSQIEDLPGDLNTFLVRKSEPRKPVETKESDLEESGKQEDDDGNDTDDLLRMLGDSDEKRKKHTIKTMKTMKDEKGDSSDDDEYIFEGAKVTTLQVAKNALIRRPAAIAQPENDGTDGVNNILTNIINANSSDEESERRQTQNNRPKLNTAKATPQPRNITKHTVEVLNRPSRTLSQPTPIHQYTNKRVQQGTSLLKKPTSANQETGRRENSQEGTSSAQRLMRPEQIDEEILSDIESEDDDDSLYDELPTSDSDNLEEWFTLDIRAERAGDYIPLLGDKAHQLLTEEKQRVKTKVSTLKQSLTALTESSKNQAEALRKATLAVAQLDALLKAA